MNAILELKLSGSGYQGVSLVALLIQLLDHDGDPHVDIATEVETLSRVRHVEQIPGKKRRT